MSAENNATIKEIFQKDITREIDNVIKVGGNKEEEKKVVDFEEYVVTNELLNHFRTFFDSYKKGVVGTTDNMGVWISGSFGSGKSHLLEILAELLGNRLVGDKHALDYFIDDKKIAEEVILADMKLAGSVSTDSILFNIDAKNTNSSKDGKDNILTVFLNVFNAMRGYCGTIPYVAEFEEHLDNEGQYEEFKERFLEKKNKPWEESRSQFKFQSKAIREIVAEMGIMSEDDADVLIKKAYDSFSMSIEEFAQKVKRYIDTKGNNHHVVFLVDEVGQYIGDNSSLMLNMQTVVEELGKACKGKVWVIVTSQQDIDKIEHVNGVDLSKILGRFETRLSLTSSDAAEVIKERILKKTDVAFNALEMYYDGKDSLIDNEILFYGGPEKKKYSDAQDFAAVYPFVPYQFNVLARSLVAIQNHGASGKNLSKGERTLISLFKDAAKSIQDNGIGTIVPFYRFYDPLVNQLDDSHSGVIYTAMKDSEVTKDGDMFNVNVLKTLFMIKYIPEIVPADIENITSLMISSIDITDGKVKEIRDDLKKRVEEALNVLIKQAYVERIGDRYIFLSNEEQEINRAINNQDVKSSEISERIYNMIYSGIYSVQDYTYLNKSGPYPFRFNRYIDGQTVINAPKNYEIGINILTPNYAGSLEIVDNIMSTDNADNVVVILPDNRKFIDDLEQVCKIENYIKNNHSTETKNRENIISQKKADTKEINASVKAGLISSLNAATLIVNSNILEGPEKDFEGRMAKALKQLIERKYNKLYYMDTHVDSKDIDNLYIFKQDTFCGIDKPNQLALSEVLNMIKNCKYGKVTMREILDKFTRSEYGFKKEDVYWLVAKLFVDEEISLFYNGMELTVGGNANWSDIVSYIKDPKSTDKLNMEAHKKISDKVKKDVCDVISALFGDNSLSDDEYTIGNAFRQYCKKTIQEIEQIEKNYDSGKAYPGRSFIESYENELKSFDFVYSNAELFSKVSSNKDYYVGFEEQYRLITNFFHSKQKDFFDDALNILDIYQDACAYGVYASLQADINVIEDIVCNECPYNEIHNLAIRNDEFKKKFKHVLENDSSSISNKIEEDAEFISTLAKGNHVKESIKNSYRDAFRNLQDALKECKTISEVKGFTDKSTVLKGKFAAEISRMGNGADGESTIRILKASELAGETSWTIHSLDELDNKFNALRKKVADEFSKEQNTVINLEL